MSIRNEVRLIGNLGDDPNTKYTQNGIAKTRFRVATTERRKDRDGNRVDHTEWHSVTTFGKLAEVCGEYLRKGAMVAVRGSIHYSKYTGQDGIERYYTDIEADSVDFLPSGGNRDTREPTQSRRGSRPEENKPPANPSPSPPPAMDDFADDDIPF